jgi:hypothetical protein
MTAGIAYLSNGCASCGALFGAFPLLHEELTEALDLVDNYGSGHWDDGVPIADFSACRR